MTIEDTVIETTEITEIIEEVAEGGNNSINQRVVTNRETTEITIMINNIHRKLVDK